MKSEIPFPHIAFFMQPDGEAIHVYEMRKEAMEGDRRPTVMKFVDLEVLDLHDYDGAALIVGRMALHRLATLYPDQFAKYPRLVVDVRTLTPPPCRPDAPGDDIGE